MGIRQPLSGAYHRNGITSCSWCYQQGHSAKVCPRLDASAKAGSLNALKYQKKLNGATGRLCGYCADEGHSSGNCPKRYDTFKKLTLSEKEMSEKALAWLKEIGFGPGAMLSGMARESGWNSKKNKAERIVIIEEFKGKQIGRAHV